MNVLKNFDIDEAFVKTRHLSTTMGGGTKFIEGTKKETETILKDAMRDGKIINILDNGITRKGNQSYIIIIDAGKVIGKKEKRQ